jgi:sortase A
VSENVSTQLPQPPELQPLPAPRPKIWQIVSYLFIITGLALLGWGGWLYFQTWLEASQPPPARIVDLSLADLGTPTPRPRPTEVQTTATPSPTVGKTQVEARTGSTISDTLSVTITPPADDAPTLDPEPSPTATIGLPDDPVSIVDADSTPEPSAETVLSLEDNPLVVPEEETQPAPVDAASASNETAPVATAAISRIVGESIGLDSPVVEVGWKQVMQNSQLTNVWEVAEYAAGWHKNSMLPGQGGNIVLSGHHNIKGKVFRYIVDLEPGAVISLFTGDQRHDYTVVDKFIVKDKGEPEAIRRENAKWVGPFNEERVTLVTCWPYTNNTHRVIVIAKPVETAGASVNAVNAGGQ